MSIIYRDSWIENVEEDVEYLKSLIDEGIADIEAQVVNHETRLDAIDIEQTTQNNRLDVLET